MTNLTHKVQASEGEEPLEWVRFPSVPTTTLEQTWERVDWYGQTLCSSKTITNASKVGVAWKNGNGKQWTA